MLQHTQQQPVIQSCRSQRQFEWLENPNTAWSAVSEMIGNTMLCVQLGTSDSRAGACPSLPRHDRYVIEVARADSVRVRYQQPEGVPLVSCHRMLEPGSSCHFFSSIFCLAKVIFKSQKQFLILGKFYFWSSCYFFGAHATFWSSCWVLAHGGGSSVRRPLNNGTVSGAKSHAKSS